MRYNEVHKYYKSDAGVQFPCTVPYTWAGIPHYADFTPSLPSPSGVWHQQVGEDKVSGRGANLIGNQQNFFSAVRERFVPKLCSRSTFPPVLDDLKSSKTIEDIAIQFYNRGRDGTCSQECTPRTAPMLTVNWETLDKLDKDPRYWYSYTTLHLTLSRTAQPSGNVIRCAIFPPLFLSVIEFGQFRNQFVSTCWSLPLADIYQPAPDYFELLTNCCLKKC